MKRITSLLVCFAMFGLSVLAQDIQISGKVTSADDGSALPGVSVVVKGTTVGTTTNIDGDYSLSVPANATLVFTFVGMKTQEIAVGNQTTISTTMEMDVTGLEEVVVTAFGITKEKKSLAYSTETVDNEQVTQAAQPNVTNALQGKVAGVSVRQSSGMPGASSYILIRGAASLEGDNQPLYIVDGMPFDGGAIFTEGAATQRVSGTDATSRSLDINPEDIENIEVLKGANASALYGLRASNGVILITTKSGKETKGGSQVNFTTSYTVDQVTRLPELQSTYAQGNAGILAQNTSMSWGPRIDELGRYYNTKINDSVDGRLYDNVTPFFETGSTYTADISLAKSGDFGSYNVSMGYLDQKGVIPTTALQRYTGKINGEIKMTDKITIGGSVLYANTNNDKIANGSNLSNPLFTVYYAPRSYDLWGLPYANENDPYQQIHYRAAMDNPRWSLANNEFNEINDRVSTNGRIAYKPVSFLTIKYQIGVDYISNAQKEVYELGSGQTGGRTNPPSGGQLTEFSYIQREVNSNLMLMFEKKFGDFNTNLLLGNEMYQEFAKQLSVVGSGFNLGGYHNMANTSTQVPTEYTENRRTVGFYGSATADYKSILYLTATGRNDYVSYLAAGNRSYFYPSFGGSFVFSELLDGAAGILSFGKLRASWAEVGQSVPYTYGTQNIYVQGGAGSGYLQDGISVPLNGINGFSKSDILRSEELKPQTSQTTEFGIDLRFFDGLFSFDYTYYTTMLVDQIFQVPIPASTGYTAALTNAGTMKSVGHEVILNIAPVRTSDFRWDISMNYTAYENTVEELAEGVENIYLGGFETPSVRALEGQTYPSIYGIGFLRDDAGNIVVLDNPGSPNHGMPLADESAKKIGEVTPDFFIGFTNSFNYKGIILTAQIDWQQGGQMYSGNNRLGRLYGMLSSTEDRETKVVLDGSKGYVDPASGELVVTGTNDIAILRGENYWNTVLGTIDEAHVHETSYVRFRELAVGYQLPSSLLKDSFLKSVSISVVGRNLALWSSYPNFDPETSTTGATNGQGIEYVALPQTMSFGGKLSVTF